MTPAAKKRKASEPRCCCLSCDSHKAAKSFPDYCPSWGCEHLVNTCKSCMKKWIETQVEGGNFTTGGRDGKAFGIKCPECDAVMGRIDVQVAAVKKVYQRFEVRERRHIAESTPGWRWCLNPKCQAGRVHKKKSSPKARMDSTAEDSNLWECKECGAKACVTCDRPWHEDESCEEFQKRKKDRTKEEDLTLEEIRKVTKKCPKEACRKNIQKAGGCSHMLCPQCGVIFCWIRVEVFQPGGYCKCFPPPLLLL